MIGIFRIKSGAGFQWWTFGWGLDLNSWRWIKLGPLTLTWWHVDDWRRYELQYELQYELHFCNRLILAYPDEIR